MDSRTFENLREQFASLVPAAQPEDRRTSWVLERSLGIAREPGGGYELFIVGKPLIATSGLVQRHLRYGRWQATGGEGFEANRVVLGGAPHFAAIAATIVVELLRVGLTPDVEPQRPFADVEPIIEMALRRGALSEDLIVGLIGELRALEVMLHAVNDRPELRSQVLDCWRGYQHAARDICLGGVAVEVKTTRGESSSHHVNSLSQVEPRRDEQEQRLYLLSVGLRPTEKGGVSLPMVAESLLRLLSDGPDRSPLQERFLKDVRAYGAGQSLGYDHDSMADWPAYGQHHVHSYRPRLYDMMDEEVRVIRQRDLIGTHVSPADIAYRIDLPERINDLNPAYDWEHELRRLTRERLGLE